jgi:hypothetical protein
MKVRSETRWILVLCDKIADTGTIFTPTTINSTEGLVERLTTMFTPAVSEADLNASIAELLVLYPDDPAVGE